MHGSHATVLIACDAFNARAVTIQEYHYHDKNVIADNPTKDCFLDHSHESLAIFIGHGVFVRWLFSYRNGFNCFYSVFKGRRLICLSKHTECSICFDRGINLPNREVWNARPHFHERDMCHLISNDRIFAISFVFILPRNTSSTTIL